MEQITVTTERGIEKTTTLKNGDVLLEIAALEKIDQLENHAVAYFINHEPVDQQTYRTRLQQG
ncbi:hypothetical protein [Sphingobacterium deserti]|uniref:Uncharacterized protein n=1 Tax=Sphingobacterium deserti TaxID=1229276 RepID=A0A0B8SZA1_9SPHI|nr:hypothetical protein [Sphingobacterium deserti]KGE13037.1 hypothetical protein DI53_3254 [Sphingobacterium deserti]